jgi:undecaprenyl-diphosphatase
MIITQGLLGMESSEFTRVFLISIQFGTILSVVVLYWKRFFQSMSFYYKLFIAFLPAAFFGLLLNDYIDALLESVYVVAFMLIIGGVILIFVDRWFKGNEDIPDREISYLEAFKIGLFQVIAMIPGVSRSASTIIGGMTQKFSKRQAAEFSFFLAVPTMFAATAYKLLKGYEAINSSNIGILIFGNIVGFLVALVAIKSFIAYLTKHGFAIFGYYRIIVGLLILALWGLGYDLSIN